MNELQQVPKEDELREIIVTAQKIYPGRDWEGLSQDEQAAVFEAHDAQRGQGQDVFDAGQRMLEGSGKTVGPLGVYVQNPWEALGGGISMGVGSYMQGKANKSEAAGRKANADMIANRDARDREIENRRAAEEERRREEWLSQMFQGGQRNGY